MNRIDLSKLPAPQLIEELDYESILSQMRTKMREICPEWTGYELESDPANKILEVAAYREMLLRQRVNEAARSVMIAFATGSDLDHLAAFYPEERLPGAAATFEAFIKLSAILDVEVTIPAGFALIAKNGEIEARLVDTETIGAGYPSTIAVFEIIKPLGVESNGLQLRWDAITPLPFVVEIEQITVSHGGADVETDESFRARTRDSLHQHSTAGAYGTYRYYAESADVRIKDADAWSPERGCVTVAILSWEGDGTADEIMLQRVRDFLSGEDVRPGTDLVTVQGAEIIPYEVKLVLEMYPGVAGTPPINEATKRIEAKVSELHGLGMDVPRTALIASAHLEGVKRVELIEPAEDIRVNRHQAAHCNHIEIGSRIADEI